MADNFLGFTYNEEHSSDFDAFIVNGGEDLNFSNSPSFNNDFAFPQFGDVSYYLGTTKENRTLDFTIFIKEITLSDYRLFLKWLQPGQDPAILYFDYNTNFGYNVIIESISNGNFTPVEDCVLDQIVYNVTVEVSFVTVGDWAAEYLGAIATDGITFTNGIDKTETITGIANFAWTGLSSKILTITNNTTLPMYFNIEADCTGSSLEVSIDDEEYYISTVSTTSLSKIYSKYGIVLDANDSFLEMSKNLGIAYVGSGDDITLEVNCTTSFKLIPIIREII